MGTGELGTGELWTELSRTGAFCTGPLGTGAAWGVSTIGVSTAANASPAGELEFTGRTAAVKFAGTFICVPEPSALMVGAVAAGAPVAGGKGSGAAVLGHPLNALEWLVNKLASHGRGLKAGEYITTGVTTDTYMASAGDLVRADFGPVGAVELTFK